MVGEAVCGEEGVLDVQEDWGFNKPCKDIPAGLPPFFSLYPVEWFEKCCERRVT